MTDPTKLVEDTWAIASKCDTLTDVFYDKLFEINPLYKTTLFARTNIAAQKKMLAATLDVAVKNLRNPDALVPILKELGVRHCRYGVRKEYYADTGVALLYALEYHLKGKFTPEVKAAWVGVYGTVEKVMGSQCDTEEGKRLLAEYEARYPSPRNPHPAPDATRIVEDTWAILSHAEGFTLMFYEKLFELEPEFKTTLFARSIMAVQSKMLQATLDVAVKHLRDPDTLVPVLQELGMRHCRYGVRKEYYAPGGVAFLYALEQHLKEKCTPEVKAAWAGVYATVEEVMGSQCDTEEGKRLLAEYEARYPSPSKKQASPGTPCNAWCTAGKVALVAIPAVAVALYLARRHK